MSTQLSTVSLYQLLGSFVSTICGSAWLLANCSARSVTPAGLFLECVYFTFELFLRVTTWASCYVFAGYYANIIMAFAIFLRVYLVRVSKDFKHEPLEELNVVFEILSKALLFFCTCSAVKDSKVKFYGFCLASFESILFLPIFFVFGEHSDAITSTYEIRKSFFIAALISLFLKTILRYVRHFYK